MAANASWTVDVPAINHSASFEIEHAAARVALESNELCGSGLPCIIGNSDALRRVLDMVRIVAPTDATVFVREWVTREKEQTGKQPRSPKTERQYDGEDV